MLTRYPFPLWLIANATTYATLVAKAKENTCVLTAPFESNPIEKPFQSEITFCSR